MTTKQQKAFKRLTFLSTAILFNNCSTCGKERQPVGFEDLPEASKKGFIDLMNQEPYKSRSKFLWCSKCNEYSILSSPFF